MQNLVDSLPQTFDSPVPEELHGALNTFVVYNRRRCVTSSAKRRRAPGSTMVSQTPDGSFLDLMRNARDLLSRCGLHHVPEVCRALSAINRRRVMPMSSAQRSASAEQASLHHATAVIHAACCPDALLPTSAGPAQATLYHALADIHASQSPSETCVCAPCCSCCPQSLLHAASDCTILKAAGACSGRHGGAVSGEWARLHLSLPPGIGTHVGCRGSEDPGRGHHAWLRVGAGGMPPGLLTGVLMCSLDTRLPS